MIEKYCDLDDPNMGSDLRRIDAIFSGPLLLKGLGTGSAQAPQPNGFPVVTSVERAIELLLPVDLMPVPEPIDFQDFVGVVEDAVIGPRAALEKSALETATRKLDKFDDFRVEAGKRVRAAIAEHRVRESLLREGGGNLMDEGKFNKFVDVSLSHNVVGFAGFLIRAAHYARLQDAPIVARVLEAYETGGFPCGWVGPLPEDGGDPVSAVAVMHFG